MSWYGERGVKSAGYGDGRGGLEVRIRTISAWMFPVLWINQSTHVCAT